MMENKTKIDLKNKSIFITGAAGFIGSNLAKRLLSTVEGVKVVGLDNMNHYYDVRLKEARLNELEKFENFSFVKGNLADKSVIEAMVGIDHCWIAFWMLTFLLTTFISYTLVMLIRNKVGDMKKLRWIGFD